MIQRAPKLPASPPPPAKKKGAPVVSTVSFARSDLPNTKPNKKYVLSAADARAYMDMLGEVYPSGKTYRSGEVDKPVPAAWAIIEAVEEQPGLRYFAPTLVANRLAQSVGHTRVASSGALLDEVDQRRLYCQIADLSQVGDVNCKCPGCQAIPLGPLDLSELRQDRLALVKALAEGNLSNGSFKGLRINATPRMTGVYGMGATANTYSTPVGQLQQIVTATEELVLQLGMKIGDSSTRSAIAHLGNILNAQCQLIEFILCQPQLWGNKHGLHQNVLLGRYAFTYPNYLSGATFPHSTFPMKDDLETIRGQYHAYRLPTGSTSRGRSSRKNNKRGKSAQTVAVDEDTDQSYD
ncbi:MAG TPA: hypothetical protein VLS45_00545 [Methylomicrobium sp.]|nr:hypothetical protein [Methylomicrobium sp.]